MHVRRSYAACEAPIPRRRKKMIYIVIAIPGRASAMPCKQRSKQSGGLFNVLE
jgi:hypothetical protein